MAAGAWKFMKEIPKALIALKLFFTGTMIPAITGMAAGFAAMMVPMLPVIAIVAGIAYVLYTLWGAVKDAMKEFEATGSYWEAAKTLLMSFISNLIGFPLNMIKNLVSWVIEKIGDMFGIESFKNVSKAMDKFDFVKYFTEGLTWIGNWFAGMFDSMKKLAQKIIKKIPFGLGDKLSDKIFGTDAQQAEAKKAKAEEQKQFELNRKALKEKEKLEKATEEAKKREKIKAEQNALQPKSSPTVDFDLTKPATVQKASNIVSAPTSIVNANQSSSTSHSTSIKQPDPIMGMLLAGA